MRSSTRALVLFAALVVAAGCSQSPSVPGDDSLGHGGQDAGARSTPSDAGDVEQPYDAGETDGSEDAGEVDSSVDAGEVDQTVDAGESDSIDAGASDGSDDAGSIADDTPDAGPSGGDVDAGVSGNVPTPSHYPDPGATCPSGNGRYCGQTLGLRDDTLYDCENGEVQVAQECGARCVLGTNGVADACPCPDGDGVYCGDRIGRDEGTLYDCEGGQLRVKATCAGSCVEAADHASDACPPCPDGDGRACGSSLGLDAGVLYDCENGVATVVQTCSGECHANSPTVPDSCAGCPAGDGTYCGARVGGDATSLYDCEAGSISLDEVCQSRCDATTGAHDACHTCPNGVDGDYCGGAVGGDAHTLYHCEGGNLTTKEACPGECESHEPDSDDACVTCPSGNGLYCGNELGRDANTLYSCNDGVVAVSQVCPAGCVVNDPGTPDSCATVDCPNGENGTYCGSELGATANVLFDCEDGSLTEIALCASCVVADPGTPDACGACPSGDGAYCGDEVGADSNTLYDCASGELSAMETCAHGCRQNPAGTPDDCAPAPCPDGDGVYCGDEVGADSDTLYQCTGGELSVVKTCANGCEQNAPGTPDACRPESCPNGDGVYCGAEVGADEGTLYDCAAGVLSVEEQCPNGCQQNAAGTPDACRVLACPSGDGLYCGAEVGADEGTLYQCANGELTALQSCPNGCTVESAGVADHCTAGACDEASQAALAWEAQELEQGDSYSDYCLGFVNQAFHFGAGVVVPELQTPTAVDALAAYESEGALHDWDGEAPCGAILFWDANDCNGGYGHVVIANGDGTVSTSGWPFFGGSTRASIDWMTQMECANAPVGWADPP